MPLKASFSSRLLSNIRFRRNPPNGRNKNDERGSSCAPKDHAHRWSHDVEESKGPGMKDHRKVRGLFCDVAASGDGDNDNAHPEIRQTLQGIHPEQSSTDIFDRNSFSGDSRGATRASRTIVADRYEDTVQQRPSEDPSLYPQSPDFLLASISPLLSAVVDSSAEVTPRPVFEDLDRRESVFDGRELDIAESERRAYLEDSGLCLAVLYEGGQDTPRSAYWTLDQVSLGRGDVVNAKSEAVGCQKWSSLSTLCDDDSESSKGRIELFDCSLEGKWDEGRACSGKIMSDGSSAAEPSSPQPLSSPSRDKDEATEAYDSCSDHSRQPSAEGTKLVFRDSAGDLASRDTAEGPPTDEDQMSSSTPRDRWEGSDSGSLQRRCHEDICNSSGGVVKPVVSFNSYLSVNRKGDKGNKESFISSNSDDIDVVVEDPLDRLLVEAGLARRVPLPILGLQTPTVFAPSDFNRGAGLLPHGCAYHLPVRASGGELCSAGSGLRRACCLCPYCMPSMSLRRDSLPVVQSATNKDLSRWTQKASGKSASAFEDRLSIASNTHNRSSLAKTSSAADPLHTQPINDLRPVISTDPMTTTSVSKFTAPFGGKRGGLLSRLKITKAENRSSKARAAPEGVRQNEDMSYLDSNKVGAVDLRRKVAPPSTQSLDAVRPDSGDGFEGVPVSTKGALLVVDSSSFISQTPESQSHKAGLPAGPLKTLPIAIDRRRRRPSAPSVPHIKGSAGGLSGGSPNVKPSFGGGGGGGSIRRTLGGQVILRHQCNPV